MLLYPFIEAKIAGKAPSPKRKKALCSGLDGKSLFYCKNGEQFGVLVRKESRENDRHNFHKPLIRSTNNKKMTLLIWKSVFSII